MGMLFYLYWIDVNGSQKSDLAGTCNLKSKQSKHAIDCVHVDG